MPYSQEFENVLNVSLNVSEEERRKSGILNTGYSQEENTWELLVRYSIVPEAFLNAYPEVGVTFLEGNYAIMRVPQNRLEELAQAEGIIYIEIPKRLYLEDGDSLKNTICEKENSMQKEAKEKGIFTQKKVYEKGIFVQEVAKRSSDTPVESVQVSGVRRFRERFGENLTGRGVLIGIADSGIDLFHPAFRNADGSTRVAALWDPSTREYSREEINQILEEYDPVGDIGVGRDVGTGTGSETGTGAGSETGTGAGSESGTGADIETGAGRVFSRELPLAFRDLSGHGTAVAGVAAGSRVQEGDFTAEGYAPEAELVVVRLEQNGNDAYIRTTQLMQAVDYLVKKAREYGKPMAINLSIGNNYGSHSGKSLLSTYLTEIALCERLSICVGSGNEAGKPIHTSVRLGELPYEILLSIDERQLSFNVQIWKDYADLCKIWLVSPSGDAYQVYYDADPFARAPLVQQYRSNRTQILLYNGLPSPYQPLQEIFLDFIPLDRYVDSGNWRIRLIPIRTVTGEYELWLPAGNTLNTGTGFAVPQQEHTLTIPAASERVITVGAYDSRTQTYAPFSGRGFTAFTGQIKPDLAAPGVAILAPRAGSSQNRGLSQRYGTFTGTSFAVPAITGTAALLMQWGIVEKNDPWLYGSRLKSWFHRNARQLPAFSQYPNSYIGYGVW